VREPQTWPRRLSRRPICRLKKDVHSIYRLEDTLEQKITTVARQIYGAADVAFTDAAREKLDRLISFGFGNLPICMAKNQYSLSDDAERLGVPTGWTLGISDILLSAGAGFVVVVSGRIMLMPGLGKMQRGFNIDVGRRWQHHGPYLRLQLRYVPLHGPQVERLYRP